MLEIAVGYGTIIRNGIVQLHSLVVAAPIVFSGEVLVSPSDVQALCLGLIVYHVHVPLVLPIQPRMCFIWWICALLDSQHSVMS